MNQFDILTSLPTSLACGVLRDWLSLKLIGALDVAYCNKANRGFLEEFLYSDEFYVREEVTLIERNDRLCNIWNILPKFGRMLRSVSFQKKLSEAQGRMVAQHCSNLTLVNFKSQDCPPALWSILEANQNIKHMYLDFKSNWKFSGTQNLFPEGMSLPKLRVLAMMGVRFQHKHIVEALQLSGNIAQLYLFGSEVNESTIVQIAQLCPHLTALGFVAMYFTVGVLSHLTASCPHIKHLDLENTDLTDAGLLAVVQNLRGLQSLNIKFNYPLTDASLVHIYTHCANTLKTLHMNCECDRVENLFGAAAVHELLERCTKVRNFNFGYRNFSDDAFDSGITIPAATLSNLTELVLSGNIACERNLAAISRYGNNLQTLGFYALMGNECSQAAWMGLLQGCPKLTGLYVKISSRERVSHWAKDRSELTVGAGVPVRLFKFDVLSM